MTPGPSREEWGPGRLSELVRAHALGRAGPREVVDWVARIASRTLGDMCIVTLLTADAKSLQVVSVHDDDPARVAETRALFSASPYPANRGQAGRVLETGETRIGTLEEAESTLDEPDIAYLRRFGVRHWMLAPMRVLGRGLGTIGVWRSQPGSAYRPADASWLEELGDLAALVLSRAQLADMAAARAELLRALHVICTTAAEGLPLDTTLRLLLDQVLKREGVAGAAVSLVAGGGSELRLAAASGLEVGGRLAGSPAGPSAARRELVLKLTPVRADPVAGGLGGLRLAGGRPVGGALLLPLLTRRDLLGALELYGAAPLPSDTESESFFETIAAQTAMLVSHHRLAAGATRQRGLAAGGGLAGRPFPELSRSQRAILPLLIGGMSNREIARAVHLSENTVKGHVSDLLRKAGARNRVELVQTALQDRS